MGVALWRAAICRRLSSLRPSTTTSPKPGSVLVGHADPDLAPPLDFSGTSPTAALRCRSVSKPVEAGRCAVRCGARSVRTSEPLFVPRRNCPSSVWPRRSSCLADLGFHPDSVATDRLLLQQTGFGLRAVHPYPLLYLHIIHSTVEPAISASQPARVRGCPPAVRSPLPARPGGSSSQIWRACTGTSKYGVWVFTMGASTISWISSSRSRIFPQHPGELLFGKVQGRRRLLVTDLPDPRAGLLRDPIAQPFLFLREIEPEFDPSGCIA